MVNVPRFRALRPPPFRKRGSWAHPDVMQAALYYARRRSNPLAWLSSFISQSGAVPGSVLDFSNNRAFLSGNVVPLTTLLTTTRASTAAYFDTTGVLQTAAVDTPRIGALSAGGVQGLIVEGARTNLCLRSQELGVAPWQTLGATITANTVTAPDGTATADTITVTAAAGQSAYQVITVSPSTQYTFSFFCKLGSLTRAAATMAFRDDTAGAFIATDVAIDAATNAAGWTRQTYTLTTPAGCTSLRVYPLRTHSTLFAAGDVHYWGAQLEAGALASSYIPTAGETVARSADQTRLSDAALAAGLGATAGTWMIQTIFDAATPASTVLGGLANSTPSFNDCLFSSAGSTGVNLGVISGGLAQTSFAPSIPGNARPAPTKAAVAYAVNDINIAANGTVRTADTVCALPTTTMNRFYFGSAPWQPGGNAIFNAITSAAFWPSRLSDTDLQALSI